MILFRVLLTLTRITVEGERRAIDCQITIGHLSQNRHRRPRGTASRKCVSTTTGKVSMWQMEPTDWPAGDNTEMVSR